MFRNYKYFFKDKFMYLVVLLSYFYKMIKSVFFKELFGYEIIRLMINMDIWGKKFFECNYFSILFVILKNIIILWYF